MRPALAGTNSEGAMRTRNMKEPTAPPPGDQLSEITAKTLIVLDERDSSAIKVNADHLMSAIPGASRAVIPSQRGCRQQPAATQQAWSRQPRSPLRSERPNTEKRSNGDGRRRAVRRVRSKP